MPGLCGAALKDLCGAGAGRPLVLVRRRLRLTHRPGLLRISPSALR